MHIFTQLTLEEFSKDRLFKMSKSVLPSTTLLPIITVCVTKTVKNTCNKSQFPAVAQICLEVPLGLLF